MLLCKFSAEVDHSMALSPLVSVMYILCLLSYLCVISTLLKHLEDMYVVFVEEEGVPARPHLYLDTVRERW